ncbi:MAG: Gfo/Idh/MocA family oxidoreductase [Planctomycetota bacterium]|nr:Gfo/Idh/MocA family oxidoreductase [Planctomycetota bacterium]
MAQTPPLKIGLIGYGLFGQHYARSIAASSMTSLAAVAAQSATSRDAARQAHPDTEIYSDWRRITERADIELIAVVVPNHLHFEMGSAVLQANKHLLMEKPLSLQVDQCDQLLTLAHESQKILAVGHELRLSPLWGRVKALIDAGEIGQPRHVLIELARFPYRPGSTGWRHDQQRVGNWILEEPIHFFDLARWYLSSAGDPVSVFAQANSAGDAALDMADHFSAIVTFADGSYAVVSQTLSSFGHHQSAKISGSQGTIQATWGAADARSDKCVYDLRYGMGNRICEVPLSGHPGELRELADEIESVVHSIQNQTPVFCNGEDGRWSVRLCQAARESIASGLPVHLQAVSEREPVQPASA